VGRFGPAALDVPPDDQHCNPVRHRDSRGAPCIVFIGPGHGAPCFSYGSTSGGRTEAAAGSDVAEQVKRFEADTPMGRMAARSELGGPALFLLSEAASFRTGVDLIVDGGFVCW
jgi:NAD(P)-dependent dehydrogenase (short-subunit alcohol dehydrogenase family)